MVKEVLWENSGGELVLTREERRRHFMWTDSQEAVVNPTSYGEVERAHREGRVVRYTARKKNKKNKKK